MFRSEGRVHRIQTLRGVARFSCPLGVAVQQGLAFVVASPCVSECLAVGVVVAVLHCWELGWWLSEAGSEIDPVCPQSAGQLLGMGGDGLKVYPSSAGVERVWRLWGEVCARKASALQPDGTAVILNLEVCARDVAFQKEAFPFSG